MENNQRNSRKRLNSLILLVAFTAVMLIVSTYAWFSTQRNVTLTGLKGVVKVAEGLQISLDAERWVNAIDFNDFNQPTDGSPWTMKTGASAQYISTAEGVSFQSPRGASGGITNTTPSDYKPVSTTGEEYVAGSSDGIGTTALKFYNGDVQNFDHLEKIDDVTENGGGYFAFDVFLMNTSASTVKFDKIQLDGSSDITGNVESTGIQNTARIAFALYENANDAAGFLEYNDESRDASTPKSMTIHSANQLEPADIVAGTSTSKNIEDIAIWEPNANDHETNIVQQFAGQMTWPTAEPAWSVNGAGAITQLTGTTDFSATNYLPTYALTGASVGVTYQGVQTAGADTPETEDDRYETVVGIKDIFNWSETAIATSKLKLQRTTQTAADTARPNPIDLRSILEVSGKRTTNSDGVEVADNAFDIEPNQYHKMRIYVWIEGQDPDCINYASLGGGLTLDLGFSKPASGS